MAFGEDDSRIRAEHAAENLAVLWRIGLNLLQQDKTSKRGVRARRPRAAWDIEYMCKLVFATLFTLSAQSTNEGIARLSARPQSLAR